MRCKRSIAVSDGDKDDHFRSSPPDRVGHPAVPGACLQLTTDPDSERALDESLNGRGRQLRSSGTERGPSKSLRRGLFLSGQAGEPPRTRTENRLIKSPTLGCSSSSANAHPYLVGDGPASASIHLQLLRFTQVATSVATLRPERNLSCWQHPDLGEGRRPIRFGSNPALLVLPGPASWC